MRIGLVRAAAAGAAVSIVALLAAYGFAAYYAKPTPGGIAAAVALLVVAGSGVLYASRPLTGGSGD